MPGPEVFLNIYKIHGSPDWCSPCGLYHTSKDLLKFKGLICILAVAFSTGFPSLPPLTLRDPESWCLIELELIPLQLA